MFRYLFLTFFFFLTCTKENGCVEITLKNQSNGKYYFYWGPLYLGVDEDGSGQPLSGSVSEKVYNEFEIGDIYCVE